MMARIDAKGRMLSEGRRRFHAIVRELTIEEVARELRVKRPCVSRISCGHRRPSLDLAIAIQERLGIPCHAWKLAA